MRNLYDILYHTKYKISIDIEKNYKQYFYNVCHTVKEYFMSCEMLAKDLIVYNNKNCKIILWNDDKSQNA